MRDETDSGVPQMRVKSKQVVIAGCLSACALLACAWFFTGGIAIAAYWYFRSTPITRQSDGLFPTLQVETHITMGGVPLLAVGFFDRPPYDLVYELYDHDRILTGMMIDELTLRFASGETLHLVTPGDKWQRPAEEYEYYNSTGAGVVRNQARKVSHTFAGAITRPERFVITCRMRYTIEGGEEAASTFEIEFHPVYDGTIGTGWSWISSV